MNHDDNTTQDRETDSGTNGPGTTTDQPASEHSRGTRRRQFVAGAATLGVAGVAGCFGLFEEDEPEPGLIGSGRAGRPTPGGTPIEALPDLEGTLTIYSGRNEFLIGRIIEHLDATYENFTPNVRYGRATELSNTIINEGSGTPADVFYSVNAGALGLLADADRTRALSADLSEAVDESFRTDDWIGTSGRARSIPYNTNTYAESDLPSDIMDYENFEGEMGWAPAYGSCQAFVSAMRILEGESETRDWLEGVVESGVQTYPNEFAACQAIADGEIDAGFTNHYYIQRVLDGNADAQIATTFTSGDAGAVFNVAGAAVVDETANPDLSENFVRHLLSAEVQEYFAVETFEYPLIPGVEPVGELPTIDELDVPNIDLSQLSDVQATVDLMREAGVEV